MEMVAPAREVLRFECFMLDLRRRELMTVGGRCVPIEGKRFDLLAFLVSRRDQAVSRDEIVAHVWGGRAVSEGLVTVHVHELRKALKQAGCERQVIITLPSQRYRFVGEAPAPEPEALPFVVPVVPDVAPAVPGRRRLVFVAAPVLVLVVVLALVLVLRGGGDGVTAPRFSIVVLPFRNLGNDRGQDYLADAITTDLTSDLAHIPESTVIARESAEAVQSASPQEIGRRLHVRYLLRGSILPEDANFHITAYLVDTSTGAQLWTAQFDRPREGMSAAREDIVHHIASALHFQLDQLENTRSLHDRPDNPDALDLFFRARAALDPAETLADLSAAQGLLDQAIARQPDFADAKAELGWLLLRKATTMDDPDEDADFARAKTMIAQALAASPQNVKALAGRARQLQADGKCGEAKPYAMRALAIEQSSIPARSVLAKCDQGDLRFDEAAEQYDSILRLNPDGLGNKNIYLSLGYIRVLQGRYGDAIPLLDQAAPDEGEPINPYAGMETVEQARLMLIAAYGLSGDKARARDAYVAYARTWPGRTVWRVSTYFPKKWLALTALTRALGALENAGMPRFSGDPAPGIADGAVCEVGDFAPTPQSLPGGEVVNTAEVARRLAGPAPPLIIDVGSGAAVINGATWRNPSSTPQPAGEFALAVAAGAGQASQNASIIIGGDGPSGCVAYKASRELATTTHARVGWYRGGEEAWMKARLPSADRRTE